eukprot:gnl/Trimastix_PCT/1002.p1 GENE.gnl/Trimastix_PCT/1002~~gnl/Trimastix_PCT/1002.p1  ORF type:complete len:493 (-),score=175.94 gnl/Trimastix_PCT/1002:138-1571(-)
MRRNVSLLFLLGLLVPLIMADSAVLELSDKDFKETLSANEFIMVKFFTPWCGHCRKLAPIYEEAATALKDEIPFAKVDCTSAKEACKEMGIRGYPTLKFFRKNVPIDFEGERTVVALTSFARRHILPAVSVFETQEAMNTFLEDKDVAMVATVASKESEDFQSLSAVADEFHLKTVFACLVDSTMEKAALELRRMGDETEVFDGEFTKEGITAWFEKVRVPLLADISPMNAMTYIEATSPVGYLYADHKAENYAALKETFLAVARKFRGQMLFTVVDSNKFGRMAKSMGLSGEQFPVFTIESPEKAHFAFAEGAELTPEAVETHCDKALKGELEPTIQSEAVPEDPYEKNGVYQLVGNSFKPVVMESHKDVMVKFYAPWCGHCKKMQPAYEKLAKEFKDDANVIIAEMDLTVNDAPPSLGITGFPTLKLFPANHKDTPVAYTGSRGFADMKKFIRENGDLKDAPQPEPEEPAMEPEL